MREQTLLYIYRYIKGLVLELHILWFQGIKVKDDWPHHTITEFFIPSVDWLTRISADRSFAQTVLNSLPAERVVVFI